MFVGNVNDELKLREAVKSCDIVFNFAAISDLNEAIENPIQTVEINVLGNLRILELVGLKKSDIYASTIYVYSREEDSIDVVSKQLKLILKNTKGFMD